MADLSLQLSLIQATLITRGTLLRFPIYPAKSRRMFPDLSILAPMTVLCVTTVFVQCDIPAKLLHTHPSVILAPRRRSEEVIVVSKLNQSRSYIGASITKAELPADVFIRL